jgi:hypothetical protein
MSDGGIGDERKNWEQGKVAAALKRGGERREHFTTSSGIEIEREYDPTDLNGFDYLRDLGFAGEYPFTRGVQPTMYRGRLWTMRQYAGFGNAEESNRRYRYLFEHGQTGLSVAFDLPTQMGRDADHLLARGEVGRVGVSICALHDMETLLDQLPLEKISTSMTINATASILLALYLVAAERRGVGWDKLNGTIQNDVLKEYVARGTYIYPPRGSMRIITDIFAFATREVPNWNTISISGYHIREAGSTAAQELAFTLADGIAYVEAALKAGLKIDAFASRLSFFFNVHNNFFEEIAKFRAARRLWARIMKERFGAVDERSMMLRFHAQTAGSTLTAQQVDNNVRRCSAVRNRSIPMRATKRWPCPPNNRRCWPYAPSRSSPMSPTSPIPSILSAARITSRASRANSNRRRWSTWARSTTSAGPWPRSSAVTCSAKSNRPPISISAKSNPGNELSSGSTSSRPPSSRRSIFCASIRKSSTSNASGWLGCAPSATPRSRTRRWRASKRRRATAVT